MDKDFDSQRRLHPNKKFTGLSECITRGISLFSNSDDAKRRARAKFRDYRLCAVRLKKGAGKIIKSGGKSHYTWWPLSDFDILGCCDVLQND